MAGVGEVPEITTLVLVRHGQSVSNAARTIGGWRSCGGLSDLGHDQCRRLAARLEATKEFADAVLMSSSYRRAVETARVIAPALGAGEPIIDDRFGELDPGEECDGLAYEGFVATYGELVWPPKPDEPVFPGGETPTAHAERVLAAVADALAAHAGRTVVVATHGGVIDIVMRHIVGAHAGTPFSLWTTNASLSVFSHPVLGGWRIDRYNDAAHLQPGPER